MKLLKHRDSHSQRTGQIALPKDLESKATEDTDNPNVNEAD